MDNENLPEKLRFLARVVTREADHLKITDQRLFAEPLTLERLATLEQDIALSEQLDACLARFGRLQDTLGDKLIPRLLAYVGEKTGPFLDNLDKAERFNWIDSADSWFSLRQLRNKMIHEYMEDHQVLRDALLAAHDFVPSLMDAKTALVTEIGERIR